MLTRVSQSDISGNNVTRSATLVIAANDSPEKSKSQADYVCDGTADDVEIQDAINAMPNGGIIHFTVGIFNLSSTVTLPAGISYTLEGEGIASWPHPLIESTFATPSDGTQIRGGVGFLSTGASTPIIVRASGANGIGILNIKNITLMPPWGTTTSGTTIYGVVYDAYSSTVIEDNVLIVPWGWSESGCPVPSTTTYKTWGQVFDTPAPKGTAVIIGTIQIFGMGYAMSASHFDSIQIGNITEYACSYGATLAAVWNCNIDAACCYNIMGHYRLNVGSSCANSYGRGYHVGRISDEQGTGTYLINLGQSYTHVSVDYVYDWNGTLTTVTNDDLRIEGTCKTFNLGNNGKYVTIRGGYIEPGEIRTASGSLTAGNANAIAFAWHNPHGQDILIKKVVINITTPGGAEGSHLGVGISDTVAGINRGTELFDDINLNAAATVDSALVAGGGTQTVWVFCQDSASATDGWIVGQILDANASSLAGSYYIEYVGK